VWELCVLLRRFGARDAIPLFVLLLAVNPWAFAFSRSGFLEFPMLAFVLLAMLLCLRRGGESEAAIAWRTAGAGVVFAVAVLLKSTGVALAPPVLYLLFQQRGFARRAWRDVVVSGAAAAAVLGVYWESVVRRHPEDVRFYLSVVQDTFHTSGVRLIADASRPFRYGMGSDHLLFALSLVVLVLSVLVRRLRPLWREPLFALSGVWLVCFLGFMVKHQNNPARYFALTIPAVVILAIVLLQNQSWAGLRLRRVLLALVVLDAAIDAAQVAVAMTEARYTFHDASVAIGEIVRADGGHSQVMIGDDAHEVALQNGLQPVNLLYHGADINEFGAVSAGVVGAV
jgi:4-amino-4-deoxy-L-arabinose transferase-like glycosyltransferase